MSRHRDPKVVFVWAWLLCAGWALAAAAGEIYTWVDANGVTHYSETPPPGLGEGGVGRLAIPQGPSVAPSVGGDSDYRSMLEVARELEASRLAREDARLRQENARLRQQLQEEASRLDYGGEPDERYAYPVPYYLPYLSHRPLPGHPPVHRPPHFPPDGGRHVRPGHPRNLPQTGDPTVNRWLQRGRWGGAMGRSGTWGGGRSAGPALRLR